MEGVHCLVGVILPTKKHITHIVVRMCRIYAEKNALFFLMQENQLIKNNRYT